MDLAAACYQATKSFPREETFGLTSQIRRAAVAIPANIAEGHGWGTRKEYRQFLRVAQASLRELETHLILSLRVSLLPEREAEPLLHAADQLGRMLNTLQQRLQSPPPKSELRTPHPGSWDLGMRSWGKNPIPPPPNS
jgi:four helix bundle protein